MATAFQRQIAARIGAHARWANDTDPQAALAPARRGFMARFEREVDPYNTLSPAERARRAEHAMKAHMGRLALIREAKKAKRLPRQRATHPDNPGVPDGGGGNSGTGPGRGAAA